MRDFVGSGTEDPDILVVIDPEAEVYPVSVG